MSNCGTTGQRMMPCLSTSRSRNRWMRPAQWCPRCQGTTTTYHSTLAWHEAITQLNIDNSSCRQLELPKCRSPSKLRIPLPFFSSKIHDSVSAVGKLSLANQELQLGVPITMAEIEPAVFGTEGATLSTAPQKPNTFSTLIKATYSPSQELYLLNILGVQEKINEREEKICPDNCKRQHCWHV